MQIAITYAIDIPFDVCFIIYEYARNGTKQSHRTRTKATVTQPLNRLHANKACPRENIFRTFENIFRTQQNTLNWICEVDNVEITRVVVRRAQHGVTSGGLCIQGSGEDKLSCRDRVATSTRTRRTEPGKHQNVAKIAWTKMRRRCYIRYELNVSSDTFNSPESELFSIYEKTISS